MKCLIEGCGNSVNFTHLDVRFWGSVVVLLLSEIGVVEVGCIACMLILDHFLDTAAVLASIKGSLSPCGDSVVEHKESLEGYHFFVSIRILVLPAPVCLLVVATRAELAYGGFGFSLLGKPSGVISPRLQAAEV